jgi:hypothetical protein
MGDLADRSRAQGLAVKDHRQAEQTPEKSTGKR